MYLGGKSKLAKWFAAAINPVRGTRVAWDAFCGGFSISAELSKAGPVISSDANAALTTLYQAVAAGWDPPEAVTEAQYKGGKALPDTDPMKAFLGFGCSFGGKWFAGFARSKDPKDGRSVRGYASQARNVLLRDVGAHKEAGGVIRCANFLAIDPAEPDVAADAAEIVLYLDPPYEGTEAYGATAPFDHVLFWHRVRQWAELTDVFVSEYNAPGHNVPLLEFTHDLSVSGGVTKDARRERFYHFSKTRPWRD
jgi:DNA adenine methylase